MSIPKSYLFYSFRFAKEVKAVHPLCLLFITHQRHNVGIYKKPKYYIHKYIFSSF